MSARIEVDILTKEWDAAAVDADETTALFSIREGDVILEAHAIKKVLAGSSTTPTWSLGDGGDVDRFIAVTDAETGSVGDLVAGVTAAFPYLYTADDTIDVDYIDGATPGTPVPGARFYVARLKTAHA